MSSLAVQPSLAKLFCYEIFSFSSFYVLLLLNDQMSLSKHFPVFPTPSLFSFTDQMFSFSESFPTQKKISTTYFPFPIFFPLQKCSPSFQSPFFVLKKDKTFCSLSFSIILLNRSNISLLFLLLWTEDFPSIPYVFFFSSPPKI